MQGNGSESQNLDSDLDPTKNQKVIKRYFFVKALTLHQTLKDFLNIENVKKKNIMHQCLNNFLLKCSAQTNGGRIRILIRGII